MTNSGDWFNPLQEIEEYLDEHNLDWNQVSWIGVPGAWWMSPKEFIREFDCKANADVISVNFNLHIVGKDWFIHRRKDVYTNLSEWTLVQLPELPPNHNLSHPEWVWTRNRGY